ncbi:MAG TPA: response regulator [Candidatus Limnocylindrales bacterium]|nr:response regulator [Candidatus Limnocylindrales bacterium]
MSASPHPTLPRSPRVVIVDADRRVQQSLADLLGVTGEVRVVGRAGDVRAALELVEQERPDAVLVDPRLPDVEAGLALVAGLARAWPSMRVVMTGWSDTEGHAPVGPNEAAYVSKSATPEQFAAAIVLACGAA